MWRVLRLGISGRIARQSAVLAALCMLFAVRVVAQGRTLYLLTGTQLNDTSQTFPVRLYTVRPDRKLKLFRQVVAGNEGTSGVLDDTGGHIYVEFPSDMGVSSAPTAVSIIHKRDPAADDIVRFNSTGMSVWPYATAAALAEGARSYALLTLFPGSPPPERAAFNEYIRSRTQLMAFAGAALAGRPRVT